MSTSPTQNRPSHDELLARAASFLVERIPDLVVAYAFGSAGTAHERAESDVDLAISGSAEQDPVQIFALAGELAAALGRDVDLVDLRSSSTVFRAEVVSKGRRIFARDASEALAFEGLVYSEYALLNEERRGILEDIAQRGTIHGR